METSVYSALTDNYQSCLTLIHVKIRMQKANKKGGIQTEIFQEKFVSFKLLCIFWIINTGKFHRSMITTNCEVKVE